MTNPQKKFCLSVRLSVRLSVCLSVCHRDNLSKSRPISKIFFPPFCIDKTKAKFEDGHGRALVAEVRALRVFRL